MSRSFLNLVFSVTGIFFLIVALFVPLNNLPVLGSFIPLNYENETGIYLIMANFDILGSIAFYAIFIMVILVLLKKGRKL